MECNINLYKLQEQSIYILEESHCYLERLLRKMAHRL